MTLLLDLLYIYVVVFSFYFLFLAIKNLNTKSFKKQQQPRAFNFVRPVRI